MNRVDILILAGSSAASCAIGAAVAHIRTKKKLTEFFEKQVEVEVTAALHIQAEKMNAVHLAPYRPEGLLVEDVDLKIAPEFNGAEKVGEVDVPQARADGRVPYHLVTRATSARSTVISGGVLTPPTEPVEEENLLDFQDHEMVALENLNRREQGLPYAVTYEEYTDEVAGFVSVQLVYYEADGILADYVHEVQEIDETIDEFNLNLFGYLAEGDIVYVCNQKKKLLIEVARDSGSFAAAKA